MMGILIAFKVLQNGNWTEFSFLTPVTSLNRPNTGKEDDDDDKTRQCAVTTVWLSEHAKVGSVFATTLSTAECPVSD
jgi:hypothetical protein